MLPPPGIFVGISPVDATCGDAVVNYRFAGWEKKARDGVKYSLRETTGGNIVAAVDEDTLSGIDLTQWNDTTKKQLKLLPEKR